MIFSLGGLLFFAVVGFLAIERPGARRRANADARPSGARVANPVAVACASLVTVGSFWFWTGVVVRAAAAQRPFPVWFSTLPLLVIDDRAPLHAHAPLGTLAAAAAALATLGLCGLFFALRGRRADARTWAILGVAFASMAAIALATHAVTSFDLYAYAGAAHGGLAAGYEPSRIPFPGEWHVLNAIYGTPIVPSPYGPVWLAIAYAVTAWAPSLGVALATLRVLELAAIVGCVAALYRLGLSPAVLAAFALNPALFANFVVDGHNDILAIAFVLAAAAVRTRVPALAIVLGACAGCVKLPFVVIAPLAFAGEADATKRIVSAAATVGLALALSLGFGGAKYVAALHETVLTYGQTISDPTVNGLRFALLGIAVAAVVAALAFRRYVPTLAWAFVAFGTSLFGWYLAWGIPYAVAQRRWFAAFLISLPALNFFISTSFSATVLSTLAFRFAIVIAPALAYLAIRREQRMARLVVA